MPDRILATLGLRTLRAWSAALAAGIGCALVCFGRPGVFRRWRNASNTGSAAVEFAITAPVLVALVIGAADYSIMANKQDVLEAATRAGAEYARANPGDGPTWTNTKSYVSNYTTFSPAVTVTPSTVCSCADGSSPGPPGGCAGTCSVGNPPDTRVLKYAVITATQNFSGLLLYNASVLFNISLGSPGVTLHSTTVARLQ